MREVWSFIFANPRWSAYAMLLMAFIAGIVLGSYIGHWRAYRKKPGLDYHALERRARGYDIMKERLGYAMRHIDDQNDRIITMKNRMAVIALFLGKAVTEAKQGENNGL